MKLLYHPIGCSTYPKKKLACLLSFICFALRQERASFYAGYLTPPSIVFTGHSHPIDVRFFSSNLFKKTLNHLAKNQLVKNDSKNA